MRQGASCPDCGAFPVIHFAERLSAIFDWFLTPTLSRLDVIGRPFWSLAEICQLKRCALPLLKLFKFLRLGTITTRPDNLDSTRTKFLWEAADRYGIALYQFRILGRRESSMFVALHKDKIRVFDGLPRPIAMPSKSLDWMDNKGIIKSKFKAAGIPVPRGRVCVTYENARRTLNELGGAVVVKPHLGSRSRHTTVHVLTPAQLKVAFQKAKQLSPWVVIEEEFIGFVFRITVVNGKVVGITRREPAHVLGDGRATVLELVQRENRNPIRLGNPVFHPLPTDDEAHRVLQKQGLDWNLVPSAGRFVVLNEHVSRDFGGSTTDFTDSASEQNILLFGKVAKILNDSLFGLDFIISDMTKPWSEQKQCGVIECNSLPGLDLHQALVGKTRDVAGALWEAVFPESVLIPGSSGMNNRPR